MKEVKIMYKCTKDLISKDFAVGVVAGIEEWRQIAINWAENDENFELTKTLKKLRKNEVINFVQDFWQIKIVEV